MSTLGDARKAVDEALRVADEFPHAGNSSALRYLVEAVRALVEDTERRESERAWAEEMLED